MEINKIYNEDCLETMNRIPDNFVDLVVTSPPYDDIRKYNGYVFRFEKIAEQLFRIIKLGGVVVWIVGDSTINGSESGTSFRQALYFMKIGFNLHDTMIYEKNGAAYPANENSNRYSQIFEYMFIFSKGKPKTANLIKDRKNKWGGHNSFGTRSERNYKGNLLKTKKINVANFGYRNNIWKYNTGYGYTTIDKIAYEHPAIFPDKLANDHILTWSDAGELVYDPFAGSGTTIKMSHLNKRNWIASEISETYVELMKKRLQPYLSQPIIFGL